MDHVINAIKGHLDPWMDWLRDEWHSGKYKKLTDCPSYSPCKAMVDAIHILEINEYGKKRTMTVRQMME